MNLQFYFLLNIILLSRLLLTFQDTPTGKKQTIFILLIQGIGLLLFQWNLSLLILAIILIVIQIIFSIMENRFNHLNELRLASLAIYIISSSIIASSLGQLQLNAGLSELGKNLGNYSTIAIILRTADWMKINILILGLLVVSNESNFLIRYLFQAQDLTPQTAKNKDRKIIDIHEFNAGRIIGILERALIYYFVLKAQYEAIGLILAAKSFARFKQMDEREFAEYILIGTLVSAALALAVAGLIKQLLP